MREAIHQLFRQIPLSAGGIKSALTFRSINTALLYKSHMCLMLTWSHFAHDSGGSALLFLFSLKFCFSIFIDDPICPVYDSES